MLFSRWRFRYMDNRKFKIVRYCNDDVGYTYKRKPGGGNDSELGRILRTKQHEERRKVIRTERYSRYLDLSDSPETQDFNDDVIANEADEIDENLENSINFGRALARIHSYDSDDSFIGKHLHFENEFFTEIQNTETACFNFVRMFLKRQRRRCNTEKF